MTRWRRRACVWTVAGLVVVAAVSCRGSGGGNEATPATSAPPATSPPTTQDKKADAKIAKAALLELDDLKGDTWTVDRTSSEDSYGKMTDACSATTDELTKALAQADKVPSEVSPLFSGDKADISNKVTIFADEDSAHAFGAALATEALPACLQETVLSSLRMAGAKVDDSAVKVTVVDDAGPFGDEQVVLQVVAAYDPSQIDPEAPQEWQDHDVFVFARVGRGWTDVDYHTSGERASMVDVKPVVTKAVEKLEAQLTGT